MLFFLTCIKIIWHINWQGIIIIYTKNTCMKTAFITIVPALALASFFSFTNNKPVSPQHEYSRKFPGYDTVPHKKDSIKRKSTTTPYDSFGKPKKMDTTSSK
jgi:hypothetical protein